MKVFLDDARPTPEGWWRTYTVAQTIELLKSGQVDELSLDHDLGDPSDKETGYRVLLWLEEQVALDYMAPPNSITVHSANGPGASRMNAAIHQIYQYATRNNLPHF